MYSRGVPRHPVTSVESLFIYIYILESLQILNVPPRISNMCVMRIVEGKILVLKYMNSTLHSHILYP